MAPFHSGPGRPGKQTRMLAIGFGAAAAMIITGVAAINVIRARAGLRRATEASLANYAAVAGEQFANAAEALVRQNIVPILPPPGYVDPVAGSAPPLADLREMIAQQQADPCHCLFDPEPDAVFRLSLDEGAAVAEDRLGGPHLLDHAVAAAVASQAESLAGTGWRYGALLVTTSAGDRFVYFTRWVSSATGKSYAYGIVVPASVVERRIFDPVLRTVRLVPRHLITRIASNQEYLALEIRSPAGQRLFASPWSYPAGAAGAITLPTLRSGLTLEVRLNPTVASALVPGGIPAAVPVADLAVLGAAMVFILALAWLGLRAADLGSLRADFAASVTHELRTPLTQIRLSAETVLYGRARDPGTVRQTLGSIVAETSRLQQMVDNVLHYSRAERFPGPLQQAVHDLSLLAEQVAAGLAPLLEPRGISVVLDFPASVPLRADQQAVRQVLLNLLDNAARYGPDGQVIRVGGRTAGAWVECWVEDQGPGIPAADRERVWESFVRLDRDVETSATGTGLGLTVVRQLVQAHRGTCRLVPAEGGGTRVITRWPAGGRAP